MSRNNVTERFNAIPELQAKTGAAVANDGSRIVISDGDDMVTFNVEGARQLMKWLSQALPFPPGGVDLRLIETEGRDEGLYEDIVKAWNLSRAAGASPSQVMAALQDAFLNAAALYRMTFQEVLDALRKVMNEYAASLPFTTQFVELEAAPIDMLLFCPLCGLQHIDAPDEDQEWHNPPHRSHKCGRCGTTWRPADVATNGVAEIKTSGKADNWPMLKGPTPVALHAMKQQAVPVRWVPVSERMPAFTPEGTVWLQPSFYRGPNAAPAPARLVADMHKPVMPRDTTHWLEGVPPIPNAGGKQS